MPANQFKCSIHTYSVRFFTYKYFCFFIFIANIHCGFSKLTSICCLHVVKLWICL